MLFDVFENAPQPPIIQPMQGLHGRPDKLGL
jgi:hypothetical protein